MPTARQVSLVQKLRWHVSGNISPTAFAIGDVDGHGDNAFVIGNLVGELFIFKGNNPEGIPWLTCKGLGTITAVTIGDIRNCGKNSIVVLSAEGLCHIFDISGIEDDHGHQSSTTPGNNQPGQSIHPNIPATPNIRPVPDIHNPHRSHHSTSHPNNGTPPLPPTPQNTPHGSSSPSVSGAHHVTGATPIHSQVGSIQGNGARRGSEMYSGSGAAARTSAVLANLIGTPPPSSATSIYGSIIPGHGPRSVGGNSAANSPTGTPVLKPQHLPTNIAPLFPGKDANSKRHSTSARHSTFGETQVRHIGGRRVLERANLILPVPVNINRAHIADIDGDGLNELVLARTDRILHSYALQSGKTSSTTGPTLPQNQPLNLVKLLSRTSSVSTLDISGLLSPSEDRRETVIHYPSVSSAGRQYNGGPSGAGVGSGSGQSQHDAQDGSNDPSARLKLVEKKRWALDGQIHCLSVTKDAHSGLPILLVAQPGLKFVMVDHAGNISEPLTQIQRNLSHSLNVSGPDTPTRGAGSGDVATDIVCGTHYVDGQKKDIIGLMSMDGAFALHDLESNTVKIHDLDSTHKIFGFSKLNFGNESLERKVREPRKSRPSYGRTSSRYADEIYSDRGEEDDDYDDAGYLDSEDGDTLADHGEHSDDGNDNTRRRERSKSRKPRTSTPSLLISEPYGSRFQKNDMFVGCSWSGITFFIDQEFNTAQYDFDARVCAFGAGQYAVTPGRNEPCLFYVDFEDNIYVYYNLYIQTEPSVQFQDIVKADTSLVRTSRKAHSEQNETFLTKAAVPGSEEEKQSDGNGTTAPTPVPSDKIPLPPTWAEHDMRSFIHDSLYDVNCYEDEFQRLKRLAHIERAKMAAFFDAEAQKEREKEEAKHRGCTEAAAASLATSVGGPPSYLDPRSRRLPHVLTIDTSENSDPLRPNLQQRSQGSITSGTRDQFSLQELQGDSGNLSSQYTQSQQSSNPLPSSHSPVSPTSPSSQSKMEHNSKRRPSLLIKDVLSHYQGEITPPMKSPTSPTASSSQFSKGHKSSPYASTGSTASLTNIMKRLSLKDLGNGGRLSRTSQSGSSGSSSGSGGGSSPSTIAQGGHPLLGAPVLSKGKTLETRVGKALRTHRPVGVPRNRPLGVMGRKLPTAKSRLSVPHDRDDDSEEEDDENEPAPSEDGTGETDGDHLMEFDRSSRKSIGDDEDQHELDDGSELTAEQAYSRSRNNDENDEEDIQGVYTPSTISPIPSPGRFYGQQQGGVSEPSPSLDGSMFTLAKNLLSPSNRSGASTSSTAAGNAVAVGRNSRHPDNDYNSGAPLGSSSRGHRRQRSGHGLLDAGLGLLPTREIATSSGLNSGPNSAGHSSIQDGRRSRAESVLSTGSDIGGVIVPDITLMSSSIPKQTPIQLSTSEPLSHAMVMPDVYNNYGDEDGDGFDSEGQDEDEGRKWSSTAESEGAPRPPRRSATLGHNDETNRGSGSGFESGGAKTTGSLTNRTSGSSRSPGTKGGDIKLMPAPLPRSNQHYQRQQLEQGSSGSLTGNAAAPLPSGHVSFSSNTRPSSSGSLVGHDDHGYQGNHEGFGHGLSGKASSTTSSTNASDLGSGPSSPLTTTVVPSNTILSNPALNGFKGFSVMSIPMTSPSASIASVQHQYFSASHSHQLLPNSSSSGHRTGHPHDLVHGFEDDRASIRSRTSTYRSVLDDGNDISSVLAAATAAMVSGAGGSQGDNGIYGLTAAASSTGHLVSDSLVRRLEELQQQDQDQEERQRQREREKERSKTSSSSSQNRPVALSRANSGASARSSVSHRVSNPPSSGHGAELAATAPTSAQSTSSTTPTTTTTTTTTTTGASTVKVSTGSSRSTWDDDHDAVRRIRNRPGRGQDL
ncbi:integrin alpha FG-GAP repeat-containing protein 2 [Linnemannia gamsii]|uniref:Integrin alpha FG-GAP repeat-containing protein 2 n=1 Tax=Linnemannia gamsii TaxID=64522 RepID=A0ABQ7KCV9_9FUNG|nr:integrin alpha FG-GAP repeat-containing protein 2 [Linnemannia gamsii]